MIVTLLFILLSLLAVAGAGGMLFFRRTIRCVFSFLFCIVAIAGLYLLLSHPFLAAVQLVCVFLTGAVLFSGVLALDAHVRRRHVFWALPAGSVFFGLAVWGITRGKIGAPILRSIPMWAVQERHVSAFGRELLTNYLIAFELLGLLLLVSIVSVVYLIRQSRHLRNH